MNTAEMLTKACIGIELGSTRIKAVLTGEAFTPLAVGTYDWENRFEDGVWTYSLDEVWAGLRGCFDSLRADVRDKYDTELTSVACIGISAMMHGYLAFDECDRLLVPFRTWRNTMTGQAAELLTDSFRFNVPQRWSIAHLFQAMLNKEPHVPDIAFFTTLAGYVHWKLTGEKVLGIGDASGMFPIDAETGDYDKRMMARFDELTREQGYSLVLSDLLPTIVEAGRCAGRLTEEGARLLDPSGALKAGIMFCPPEGDAGTGMVATNAVAARTGNVSAGTSIFSMVVLEKPLSRVYPEIDMVATPTGKPVAMVHCNNCTSDMNAWVSLFGELAGLTGGSTDTNTLFTSLYRKSLEGDADCGGVTVYNYLSGEPVTGFNEGRPVIVRSPEQPLTLANFLRAQLYSTLATLAAGMELLKEEKVSIDRLMGHGGLFKTPEVGQRYLAAATGSPVWVMKTAGEGGPYGMALLAAYQQYADELSLEQFLEKVVFADAEGTVMQPDEKDMAGFAAYLERFLRGLPVERAAAENL